ncbi:metalloregulator ArsR/SmtB family transcription factor [Microaerobacter geothermalis]|uniref:ArsR/SmtB family transcription factor n=1 Tax=Microaerobacter geothermalis TaxID=674972 RepID=UPI001F209126|nr:metalloregulator ArsR/SmtB family transcription factor [Microaerobacter geothermalis]MCF6093061.1 metalloregulator ArsR/SmtB family transcription factor [Microaerobacter geothermalis]
MDLELQQFKAEFFKALAHPLRIRILELLQAGDKYVHELQEHMQVESAVVSQQLAILRAKNIVVGVKEGNKVTYSVKDPAIFELLEVAKKIFNNHLVDTISILKKMKNEK